MGTKVQFESCFPGYFSMRDLNEDSNSCSWPLYYGDRTFTNGQYYNGFLPRTIADVYSGYDKDVVKRTMLEHEAIFKNQLCELHRLYRIQRDLMDEAKRKELNKNRMPVETSLSSSPLASQITSEDARKWQIPGFPLGNSVCAGAGPSTSGIEDMHSPLSSMKGSSVQASPLLSQNAGTSKDVEVLESRPSKVRRKMFDLHLPADEYIDTEVGEEQLMDENVHAISSYPPNRNRNHILAHESGVDLLNGSGGKNNCQGDALRTESCLKSKNNLADLNEPVEVEDTNTSSNDHLGCTSSHYEIEELELAVKPKSDFLGFPQQVLVNSHKDRSNGPLCDPYLLNNDNRKPWFPHMLDSGHSKNNLTSVTLQPEKMASSSQTIQVSSNKNKESATLFLANQSKADLSRERTVHGSQVAERKKESSANSHPISALTSNIPSQYAIDPSSDANKSWSHSISSWEKFNGGLNQKPMSVQVHPSLNSSATLSRSSQSSTQSHGIFGDRWHYNSNSTATPNLRTQSDVPDKNGFYHGSSSGSKELLIRFPSSNYDYLNCSSASNAAPENFMNQNSAKLYKSPNCMDLKPRKEVNLNIAHTSSSSTKMGSQQCLEVIDLERNHDDDDVVALPWLRNKPICKKEPTYAGVDLNVGGFSDMQPSLNMPSDISEARKVPNELVHQNTKSAFCANDVEGSRIGTSDSSSCKKILGFPIFEKSHILKIEPSSLTSPSVFHPQPLEVVENNRKNWIFDINLPCDQAIADTGSETAAEVPPLLEKETDTQVACVRHQIDLNFCVTEDEGCLTPSVTGSNVKIISGIDLEAPAFPEDEEEDIVQVQECLEKAEAAASLLLTQQNIDNPPDECIRIAAEAIIAISSSVKDNHQGDATYHPSDDSVTDPLHWFVELISSFGDDLENKYAALDGVNCQNNDGYSSEDYFESMTLRLTETKEEDYMPKPLVPENLVLEETGTTSLLTTRTRRGHARRGRQRRDFQRDILPGLISLSRHEVTEDLQTFGGMMRATGQLWHAGLTRRNSTRNGCGRGRRRSLINASPAATASLPPPPPPLVQQFNNVEAGLEDRNLTGWGKTTRRPRRQRCPPGNPPPALPLT